MGILLLAIMKEAIPWALPRVLFPELSLAEDVLRGWAEALVLPWVGPSVAWHPTLPNAEAALGCQQCTSL